MTQDILVRDEKELRETEYLLFLFGYVWRSEAEFDLQRRQGREFLQWNTYTPTALRIREDTRSFSASGDTREAVSVHNFLKLREK